MISGIVVLMLTESISEFNDATVSYQLESSSVSLDEIVFPSVTICNMKLVRKSFVQSALEELQKVN